jgi:hypothetical protein
MSVLKNIFRRKPKLERKTVIGDYKVLYGHEASLEAERRQIPISRHPMTVIEKVVVPGPMDVVIEYTVSCRKHGLVMNRSGEASFAMTPHFGSLALPCECRGSTNMCARGPYIFLNADSKFNLSVRDIRKGHLVDRSLTFAECPNCRNTVKPGSGQHFAIYQCVACNTRYCHDCDAGNGCPRCESHAGRIGVGEVNA